MLLIQNSCQMLAFWIPKPDLLFKSDPMHQELSIVPASISNICTVCCVSCCCFYFLSLTGGLFPFSAFPMCTLHIDKTLGKSHAPVIVHIALLYQDSFCLVFYQFSGPQVKLQSWMSCCIKIFVCSLLPMSRSACAGPAKAKPVEKVVPEFFRHLFWSSICPPLIASTAAPVPLPPGTSSKLARQGGFWEQKWLLCFEEAPDAKEVRKQQSSFQ